MVGQLLLLLTFKYTFLILLLKVICIIISFSSCSTWDRLDTTTQERFRRRVGDLICADCGAVGPPGCKMSSSHRCSLWGYRPNSSAELMYRCEQCSGMGDSVLRLIHHQIYKHHGIQLIMCLLASCGRCYFNTATFDAHIFRVHQGFSEYRKAILEEYGPTPAIGAF